MVMQLLEANAVVEPFEIAEDAMAPIGVDEYAWNDFRGVRVDERGNIELGEYYGEFDDYATEAFMLMLAMRIKSGRVVVAFDYDGEPSHGYVVESKAVVKFIPDILHPVDYFGPCGEALMRRVVSQAIDTYRDRIAQLEGVLDAPVKKAVTVA